MRGLVIFVLFFISFQACKVREQEKSELQRNRQGRSAKVHVSKEWSTNTKQNLITVKSQTAQLTNLFHELKDIDFQGIHDDIQLHHQRRLKVIPIVEIGGQMVDILRAVLSKLKYRLANPRIRGRHIAITKVDRATFAAEMNRIDTLVKGPIAELETFFSRKRDLKLGDVSLSDFGRAIRLIDDVSYEVEDLISVLNEWISKAKVRGPRQVPSRISQVHPFEINKCIGGNRSHSVNYFDWRISVGGRGNGDFVIFEINVGGRHQRTRQRRSYQCGERAAFARLQQHAHIDQIEFFAHNNIGSSSETTVNIIVDGAVIIRQHRITRQGQIHTVRLNTRGRNVQIVASNGAVYLPYIKLHTLQ